VSRQRKIDVPEELRPLLERPPDWPDAQAWRIVAAACRARGYVAWAAQVRAPDGRVEWLTGLARSRPRVVQSEAVEALIAALERVPPSEPVEIISPTSLRYLVQGRAFAPNTPERRLYELARGRRIWARYALGELEKLTNACLARSYTVLQPLRFPGEAAVRQELAVDGEAPYILYADGGCARGVAVAAWVLRRDTLYQERCWTLDLPAGRDCVRLAEFVAVADGLRTLPPGASAVVVTDHVDITDFGVHGEPSFAPSPHVATVLEEVRALIAARRVHWYWAERSETEGQRRCQALIERRLAAAHALDRFLAACRQLGLRRVFLPDFARWLAPHGPSRRARRAWDGAREEWAATFEATDSFLQAREPGPRLGLRQIALGTGAAPDIVAAFERSPIARWCASLAQTVPLGGAVCAYTGRLRSGFPLVVLLYPPATAMLIQPRPGAELSHALDAAATMRPVQL
jgi:hypothetical protein